MITLLFQGLILALFNVIGTEDMLMRALINMTVMLACLFLSVIASQHDSPEEKLKRERKHAEIDKLTKIAARQVRENEKNWGFQRSTRGSSSPDKDKKSIVYVRDFWKNDNDSVEVHDVLLDSVEDVQRHFLGHLASPQVSPEKRERIAGIGDQAHLLENPNHSQLLFSKGTHIVTVTVRTNDRARSNEVAKRFAKYYDKAIADVK